MPEGENTRIDKWLWTVRIFKTRSIAANACKKGHVLIDELAVKPSRNVVVGEIIKVKMPPIVKTYKVKALLSKRLGAKLVGDFVEDLTSEEELSKLEYSKNDTFARRPHGAGRPTKKERRIIDKLKSI